MKSKPFFLKKLDFSYRSDQGAVIAVIYVSALIGGGVYGTALYWLAAYGMHFLIFTFGVGFGLHRGVAHQVPGPPATIRNFASLVGILANLGSPLNWITTHTQHHVYSDGSKDPSNPKILGWRVILGVIQPLPKGDVVQALISSRYSKEPFLLFLHRYYYPIQFFFLGALYLVAGVKGLLFLGLIPIGTSFFSLGLLSYFAHGSYGYCNFQRTENSRNIWWLWPLTFGENWHNNHHQNPQHQSSKKNFWEWDFISVYYFLFSKNGSEN
ncbi:MAG: fatty acid desaturase [Bdellovibrionota bacterium]